MSLSSQRADQVAAPRATLREFPDCPFQLDPLDVRQRHQPGQHVGELLFLIVLIVLGNRAGQFADFLSEPEKRLRGPALAVLIGVHSVDQSLEFADFHGQSLLACFVGTFATVLCTSECIRFAARRLLATPRLAGCRPPQRSAAEVLQRDQHHG